MVVVASLLDNLPNIAGLVRTSEIFNLSTLVIPNKMIIKTPAFKKMTVSAGTLSPTCQNPPLCQTSISSSCCEAPRAHGEPPGCVFTIRRLPALLASLTLL